MKWQKKLPTVKKVLIDERDQYLATSIYRTKGTKLVAVVGAGHAPGLIKHMEYLDQQKDSFSLDEISSVPPSSPTGKIFSYGLLIALLGIIAYGFINSGWDKGVTMFLYWFALNSSLTGIAALISLGHPVTIILSMLAAPITALSPTLGVGMVAGDIRNNYEKA